mmetsp:Transcript_7581/g.16134  ORF Transcript_7581/g.16134 Transcript_7581/m.16134 type:complete len:215 (-) Transcript_7581:63-707(-)
MNDFQRSQRTCKFLKDEYQSAASPSSFLTILVLHRGHSSWSCSQCEMHSSWNIWSHSSFFAQHTVSPSSYWSRQMVHSFRVSVRVLTDAALHDRPAMLPTLSLLLSSFSLSLVATRMDRIDPMFSPSPSFRLKSADFTTSDRSGCSSGSSSACAGCWRAADRRCDIVCRTRGRSACAFASSAVLLRLVQHTNIQKRTMRLRRKISDTPHIVLAF